MDSSQTLNSIPAVENENFDRSPLFTGSKENSTEIQKECNNLDILVAHNLTPEKLNEDSNLSSSDLSENPIKEAQKKCGAIFWNTNDSFVICCRFCFQWFTEFDEFITHVRNYHQHDKDTNFIEDDNSDDDKINFMPLEPIIQVNISNNENLYFHDDLKYNNSDEENYNADMRLDLSDTEFQQIQDEYLLQPDVQITTNFDQNPLKFPIVKQVRIENNIIKQFPCDYCGRPFKTKDQKLEHENIHTGNTPYKCRYFCGESFRARKMRWNHEKFQCKLSDDSRLNKNDDIENNENIKTEGNDGNNDCSNNEIFTCRFCSRTFGKKNNLRDHELTHTNERPYKCTHCNESFRDRKTRWRHKKIHENEIKTNNTDQLAKVTEILSDIEFGGDNDDDNDADDERKQNQDAKYNCKLCNGTFSNKKSLLYHERSHTRTTRIKQEKEVKKESKNNENEVEIEITNPLQCRYCRRIFKKEESRVQHELLHTGGTPFGCRYCLESFKSRIDRVEHEVIHENLTETGEQIFECAICNKIFRTLRSLRKHKYRHMDAGNHPYKCKTCSKIFTDKTTLTEHELIHTNEKPYECPHCDERFRNKKSRYRHQKVHHTELLVENVDNKIPVKDEAVTDDTENDEEGENMLNEIGSTIQGKLFACTYCNKIFKDKRNKFEHELIHTGETPYNCRFCEKSFRNRKTRWSHEQNHKISSTQVMNKSEEKPIENEFESEKIEQEVTFKCRHCERAFRTRQSRWAHEQSHQYSEIMQSKTNESTIETTEQIKKEDDIKTELTDDGNTNKINPLECRYCHRIFRRRDTRLQHESLHAGANRFMCRYCEESFKSRGARIQHEISHLNPAEMEARTPECEICKKKFTSVSSLRQHKYLHLDADNHPYKCEVCSRTFSNKTGLTEHIKRHTGEKNFPCRYCEKAFVRSHERTEHERRHLGNKPYLCTTCGKTFYTKTKLNSHSLRHTGMKLFECDVCHKRFYSKADLATHKVSHTDEKPFSCEICGSRFARKKALKCHSEIHSETANHVCQACGKAFKKRQTYRNHIRRHSSGTLLIDSTKNSKTTTTSTSAISAIDSFNLSYALSEMKRDDSLNLAIAQ